MNPTNATQPKATLSPASYHSTSQPRKVSIGRLGAAPRRNGRFHAHRRGNNRSGIRGSDSFAVLVEPLTPLESGGNACVREGVTAQPKHAPFAVALRHHRRSTVDGTTRVRPHSNRWRSPGIRTRRCDARYRVRHKRIPRPSRTPNTPDPRFEGRRVAHEPGTLHARSGSCPRGTRDRPDAPRRNPRPSGRGGCQGQTSQDFHRTVTLHGVSLS